MFGRNFINGSVECLGIPDFMRTYEHPWTANLLAHYSSWIDRRSSSNPNWGSQSGGESEIVSVPWNRPVCVLPVYHRRNFENMCSSARRVRDDLILDNRTARMQSPSTCCNPIRGRMVNWWDGDWGDLWDEPVDQ